MRDGLEARLLLTLLALALFDMAITRIAREYVVFDEVVAAFRRRAKQKESR